MQKFPFGQISMLGVVTIAAYGTWFYTFGVLLDPILEDTGWPERWVSGAFALSAAGGGLLAPLAGRLLDRYRSRVLFLAAALLSSSGLLLASAATTLPLFVLGGVVGGASLSAFGFYHVTQTTAVRVAPHATTRAIAVLTIYGAFASTIYLPVAAALVQATDWRTTLRILVVATTLVLLLATVVVKENVDRTPKQRGDSFRQSLARTAVRRYAIATAGVGVASGVILVYQVPLMTAAGLPLTTAAALAGARGMAQLGGRVPLTWMVDRLGARASLQLAFAAVGVGVLLLAATSGIAIGLVFVVIAGFGIGATSPLQGIYASQLFRPERLGSSMGMISMIFGLSTAAGPAAVGVLADLTGNRWWGIVIGAVAAAMATALMGSAADVPNDTAVE